MKATTFSFKYYLIEYVYKVSQVILIIPMSIILITLASYFEISCSYIQIRIKESSKIEQESPSILIEYISKMFLQLLLECVYSILASIFVARSYQCATRNFFYEYIHLNYLKFHNMGVGTLNLAISRRSIALTEFLTTLTIRFVSNFGFLMLVFDIVRRELPRKSIRSIIGLLSVFFTISTVVQRKRAELRKKINQALETNSSISFDILMNYERVITYDNVEIESKKYYEAMREYVYYKRIYELTYELLGFFNSCLLVFITYFILKDFDTSASRRNSFLAFILISTKLKEAVYDISKDIDHLFVSYSNLVYSNLKMNDFES